MKMEKQSGKKTDNPANQFGPYHNWHDTMPFGLFSLNGKGFISTINLSGEKMLGLKPGRLVNRKFMDFVSPEDRSAYNAWLRKIHARGGWEKCVIKLEKSAGEDRFIRLEGKLVEMQKDVNLCFVLMFEITESKRLENHLRENEERFQQILQQTPYPIAIFNPDGTIIMANRALLKIFNIGSPSRFINRYNIFRNSVVMKKLGIGEHIKKAFDGKTVVVPEFNLNSAYYTGLFGSKAGREVIAHLTMFPILDEKKGLKQVAMVLEDITESCQVDERLRESEEKYRFLIENQQDAIVRWLPDTTLLYVNKGFCDGLGIKPEDVIGKKWLNFIAPETRKEVKKVYSRLIKNPKKHSFVHKIRGFKEGVMWMSWLDVPVMAKGKMVEFYSIGRDITESRNADEELKKSEETYRSLVEIQKDMICRWRPDMTLTFVNKEFCRMFRTKREEVIGTKWSDLVPENVKGAVMGYISRLRENPRPDSYEEEQSMIDSNGMVKWISWINTPIMSGGRLMEFQSIGRDVTASKIAREELSMLSHRILIAREEEKKYLSSRIHDDTGTYSVAINSLLELGRDALKEGNTKVAADYLDKIQKVFGEQTDKFKKICYEILPPSIEHTGLGGALNQLVENARSGSEATICADFNLPDNNCLSREVEMAAYRIAQESLTNALKHSKASRISLKISLDADEMIMEITDNGRGFNQEEKMMPSGEGKMGLLFMNEAARSVWGKLNLKSDHGRGTTIRAVFPSLTREKKS